MAPMVSQLNQFWASLHLSLKIDVILYNVPYISFHVSKK